MTDQEKRTMWLKSLQAGQWVARMTRHHGYALYKIERLTAKQFVMKDEHGSEARASRESGYFVGDRGDRILQITQQVQESREQDRLQLWLSDIAWHNATVKPTLAQLRAMKRAFDRVAYETAIAKATVESH